MKSDTLLKVINTHIPRYVIRNISNKKTKSGKNLLEQYFYCYFSDTVTDDMKSFLNYKMKGFNFVMNIILKPLIKKNSEKNKVKIPINNIKEVISGIKSIGFYGIQKPFFLINPISVMWNFTNECNLTCKHCYQDAGAHKKDELTLEEKFDVVDQIVESGCAYLTFAGGEPLMSKDFFKVAEYARKKGLSIKLGTNGVLITKSIAEKISELGFDLVAISLDGADKETHEKIRGKDTYEKTISGIKNCVDEKIPVCISPTINKFNHEKIYEIIELGKNLGVKKFIVFNFVPVGRGKNNMDLNLSPKVRHNIIKNLVKKSLEEKDIELTVEIPQFPCFLKEINIESGNLNETTSKVGVLGYIKENIFTHEGSPLSYHTSGCSAGRLWFVVDPNGDIKPCYLMDVVVGNTRKDKIMAVWKNSEILKSLRTREDLKGNCGSCKDKQICGGCRARAWTYFKDLNSPDPVCMFNSNSTKKFNHDNNKKLG